MNDTRVTRAISLCQRVVSSFSYSWKKRRELAELQIQLGLPDHQLITESATRWGSRLQMIERVLEQESALAKVLSADKKTRPLVPRWQDIEVLEAVKKALKPLQDFTDALSGEEFVTLSYVRPVLHLLNTSLLAPEDGDTELCKSMKSTIVDYLNKKYADPYTSDLLDIASLLDPRFKGSYIASEKINALKHTVITEAEVLLSDQDSDQASCSSKMPNPTVPKAVPKDQGEAGVAVPPTAKKKKISGKFL